MKKYSIKLNPRMTAFNKAARHKFAHDLLVERKVLIEDIIITDETSVISFPKVGNLHKWSSKDKQPKGLPIASKTFTLTAFAAVKRDYKGPLLFVGKESQYVNLPRRGEPKFEPETVNWERYQEQI